MIVESNGNPVFDLKSFVAGTFKSTFLSTQRRRTVTALILMCQFIFPSVADLIINADESTYKSMAEGDSARSLFHFCIAIVKYFLLIAIIILSPVKTSFKLAACRLMVLGFFFWFYLFTDIMSAVFTQDEFQDKLAKKSFQENKKEMYAQVVFASYEEDTIIGKSRHPVVRERNAYYVTGYLFIVHIDRSIYRYKGLDEVCSNFNRFTEPNNTYNSIYNMTPRNPDILSCLYFWVQNYYKVVPTLPAIPKLNHYVKVLFDPVEHHYELFIDSSTLKTPTWDSIPPVQPTGEY